uniref:Uncharacterized protein n=1 Tax=Manihot esculenta TaxID=3983 RepID=A0A2C9VB55_MANES
MHFTINSYCFIENSIRWHATIHDYAFIRILILVSSMTEL